MKLALRSFKGFLRAVWADIGGEAIVKGLVTFTKYMWRHLKEFNTPAARAKLSEFGSVMLKLVKNPGLIRLAFKNVRSLDDLEHFIRLSKNDVCLVTGLSPLPKALRPIWDIRFDFSLVQSAYAADGCFSTLLKLAEYGKNTARFGDKAADVE